MISKLNRVTKLRLVCRLLCYIVVSAIDFVVFIDFIGFFFHALSPVLEILRYLTLYHESGGSQIRRKVFLF